MERLDKFKLLFTIILFLVVLLLIIGFVATKNSADYKQSSRDEQHAKLQSLKFQINGLNEAIGAINVSLKSLESEIEITKTSIKEMEGATDNLELKNEANKNALIEKIAQITNEYNVLVSNKNALQQKLDLLVSKYNSDHAKLTGQLNDANVSVQTNTDILNGVNSELATCQASNGNPELIAKDKELDQQLMDPLKPKCDLSEITRDCAAYNVQRLSTGEYAICPPKYSIFNLLGYETCRHVLPTTPDEKQCDWDDRCDARKYDLPCYGKWPNTAERWIGPVPTTSGATLEIWGSLFTDPVPVNAVCNMK